MTAPQLWRSWPSTVVVTAVLVCAACVLWAQPQLEQHVGPAGAHVIRPAKYEAAGFLQLEHGIDGNGGTFAAGWLGRVCRDDCTAPARIWAVWSGFPRGHRARRLEVWWHATAGVLMLPESEALVRPSVEYTVNGGRRWKELEAFAWTSTPPGCTGHGEITCLDHVALVDLGCRARSEAVRVRTSLAARISPCSGCGVTASSNLAAHIKIYDVRVATDCDPPRS